MAFFLPAFRITFENYQHTMRVFSLLLSSLFLVSLSNWGTDMENAKKQAEKEHKLIVLNFSGSDWCGPCIRLHKDIFDSDDFKALADKSLVLVNADFPRLKKTSCRKTSKRKMISWQINTIPREVSPLLFCWMKKVMCSNPGMAIQAFPRLNLPHR